MRYLIILLFLSGCATTTNITNKEEYDLLVNELLADMHQSEERIELHEISDEQHKINAQELGMSYVDYLHLVNSKKKSVNKSYIKLRHNNE